MDRPKSQNSSGTNNKDEVHGATTSNLTTSRPVASSHNMNDLKMFDFNSADEIRQAMKAMLSGNKPNNSGDEMKPQTTLTDASNISNSDTAGHVFKIVNTKEERAFSNNVRKKRPGRPPNAGPSKKIKRDSVINMFIGKLSNVVQFKHYASESESDDYFY